MAEKVGFGLSSFVGRLAVPRCRRLSNNKSTFLDKDKTVFSSLLFIHGFEAFSSFFPHMPSLSQCRRQKRDFLAKPKNQGSQGRKIMKFKNEIVSKLKSRKSKHFRIFFEFSIQTVGNIFHPLLSILACLNLIFQSALEFIFRQFRRRRRPKGIFQNFNCSSAAVHNGR